MKTRLSIIFFLSLLPSFIFSQVIHREQFDYNWYAARQSLDGKQYSKALVQFLFCEQVNPQDGKTKDYLGMLFISLHDTALAYSYFKEAYKYDPEGSWRNYATLLFNANINKEEAIKIVEDVVKNNQSDDKCCLELLNMYDLMGKYDKAIKLIDHIEKIQDPNENTLYEKCRILCALNKENKAVEQINEFLLSNESLRLIEMKIMILRSIKNTKWADLEKAYLEYLNIAPNNLDIQNSFAWDLAFLHRDLNKSEQISMYVVENEPNNPIFLDTYAMILYAKGQKNLALFYITKALDIAKKSSDKQLLKRIQSHFALIQK